MTKNYKKLPKWGISHLLSFVYYHWIEYQSIPLYFHFRDSKGNGRVFHYDEFKEFLTHENFINSWVSSMLSPVEILTITGSGGEEARKLKLADSYKITLSSKSSMDMHQIKETVERLGLDNNAEWVAQTYNGEKKVGNPYTRTIFGKTAGMLERQFGLSPIDDISNSEANR
tara:strand:- start:29 stop:541 length:513 start_codon:yes stop_codon:yes gene_type:complete